VSAGAPGPRERAPEPRESAPEPRERAPERRRRASGRGVLVAGPGDDADIRALLRESVMDGAIRLALTREPRFALGAEVEGERHYTVLVRDPVTNRLLGMGSRSVREVFHHGEPARLGYLAQFRTAPGSRHVRCIRQAFGAIEAATRPDELSFDLTSIVADNAPARRLLERGLPGLPVYRPLAEAETLVMPTADPVWARRRRMPAVRQAGAGDMARVVGFLQAQLRRHALAPRWTESDLRERCRDLAIEHFALLEEQGALRGVGAVWDQRAFKQVVIAGYQPWLQHARRPLNAVLHVLGQPRLPPAGASLALGYLSHFALAADDDLEGAVALFHALRGQARSRGLDQLAVTLAADHPLRAALGRRFGARPYRSILYAVRWRSREAPEDARTAVDAVDILGGGRRLYVEAAIL
jgi:hypothetical protein